METVRLNSGTLMPMLGLGTYALRGAQCERSVLEALELGYRLFDTAQMYGNERETGLALRRSGLPREEYFVTTKLWRQCRSFRAAKEGIEASLEALNLDSIDLLLIHEPWPEAEEMYPALEEAFQRGLLKAVGISNFSAARCADFLPSCRVLPAVNQVETHVFFQQRELREAMRQKGIHVQAWSPLAAGSRDLFRNPVLMETGRRHGRSAGQTALRYLLQLGVSVIPKASGREHMAENIAVFDFSLEPSEMRAIEALESGRSLFGWY